MVAADVGVSELGAFLDRISSTPRTVTALVDARNRLIGRHGAGPQAVPDGDLTLFTPLAATGNPVLAYFDAWTLPAGKQAVVIAELAGVKYALAQRSFALGTDASFRMLAYAPMSEFSGHIPQARDAMLFIAGLVMLVARR